MNNRKKVNNVPRIYAATSMSSSAVNHDDWRARSNAKPVVVTRKKLKEAK